jgi:hypothetical protein
MLIQNQIAVTLFFNKIYHHGKICFIRLEAKVGKDEVAAFFKKCFAVSRRARHCELVWITNGTIYLLDDTLKLRKVEKHILKVKLQKL